MTPAEREKIEALAAEIEGLGMPWSREYLVERIRALAERGSRGPRRERARCPECGSPKHGAAYCDVEG